MRILLYEWEAYLQTDVKWILKEKSVSVDTFSWKFQDKNRDGEFESWFEKEVGSKQYDLLLSINYWPMLSVAAQKKGLKYIAWCYDNPLNVIEIEKTLGNPVNYAFLFDRKQAEHYISAGFDTVYYLPLGVNAARMKQLMVTDADRKKFGADISLVGSLYESRIGEIMALMDEYMRGYIDAAMAVQQNLYGCYLLDEMVTDELVQRINRGILEKSPDTHFRLRREALTFAMASEITRRERLILLETLGKRFETRLYSFHSSQILKSVKCFPPVDYLTEMPKIFFCTKVNLNPSLKCIQTGIPLRAFDIMGAGGFLLSNYQEEMLEMFVPEQDLAVYESIEDAIEKTGYYIQHDDLRRKIASNGQEKVLESHTLQARFETIMQIAAQSRR